jgi:hypothetical protein
MQDLTPSGRVVRSENVMVRPNPGPDMKRLADEFVELMQDLGWELDYSEASVQTLENMITTQFGGLEAVAWRQAGEEEPPNRLARRRLPRRGDDPACRR